MCRWNATPLATSTSPLSLYPLGAKEAERHKWIESEKAGRDLGDEAIRAWVRKHWNGFLRRRWLEHLEGSVFWIELDHVDYGLLGRVLADEPLRDEILRRLVNGEENLDVIRWAIEVEADLERVLRVLEILDINSCRLECALELKLSQAG